MIIDNQWWPSPMGVSDEHPFNMHGHLLSDESLRWASLMGIHSTCIFHHTYLAALRKIFFRFFSDFFPIKILHFWSFKPLLGKMSIIIVASVKNWPRKSDFSTQGIFLKPILALFHVFFPVSHLEKSRFIWLRDTFSISSVTSQSPVTSP